MAIVVHHLENSRSQRVLWLLEELGVPYDIQRYARDPKTMRAPPELAKVHPLGKSPVVVDGDEVLAESGAIIEYLVEKYAAGRLAPAVGTPERIRYRYFLSYAEGSFMPLTLLSLVFRRMPSGPMPFFVRPVARAISQRGLATVVTPQLEQHLDFLEAELHKSTWFAGEEMTGADIQMSFPMEVAVARAGLTASRPKLWSFLERVHTRPAYQRALERGGPFEALR